MTQKKLSDFECGFICAMNSLANGHGIGTEVCELYREIGEPTVAQIKAADMGEYDIETIARIRKDCAR